MFLFDQFNVGIYHGLFQILGLCFDALFAIDTFGKVESFPDYLLYIAAFGVYSSAINGACATILNEFYNGNNVRELKDAAVENDKYINSLNDSTLILI